MAAKYPVHKGFSWFFLQSHENYFIAASRLVLSQALEKYEEKTLGPGHCKNTKNENINNGIN